MQAIVLRKHGETEHLACEEVPDPHPGALEVRIQIKAAGFNPVDIKIRKGVFSSSLPLILGADCAGVIDAVGKEVRDFAVGDEVIACAFGRCSNGTYAEKVALPTAFVCKKPKNLSFEAAASIPLVALTAYRALISSRALQEGKSLFIAGGTGGVGTIALQIAQICKAGPIFTTAGSEEGASKLPLPKENILLYRGFTMQEMADRLLQMNKGDLFHTACDFVGKEMKKLCFAVADYQGHIVTIVPETAGFPIELWNRSESQAFPKNLAVHFAFVGAESFSGPAKSWGVYRAHLSHIVQWIEEGSLKIPEPTIFAGLSVDSVSKAHQLIEQGKAKGKLVVQVGYTVRSITT